MQANRAPIRLMLATAVLAVAAGAMQTATAAPHEPPAMGMMMPGPHFERMLDAVNATADQKAQIKTILDTARSDLKAQRDSGRTLHEQMATLFTQPTVDARAAESLRQQMLAQHDAASKRMLQAMLDVSRVLTVDQRTQMAAQMKQHREAMGTPGGRPAR